MAFDVTRLLDNLAKVEGIAEEILTDKQKLIDLDRHRQQTREAIRVLKKDKTSNKQWLCIGKTFMKVEKKSAAKFLEKDFDNTSDQIKKTQIELRPKLSQLHEMEGKKDIRGFDLKALNKVELNAINRLL